MAQNFSTKDFFRQMPNGLLARYFHGKGLMADLDFAAMKEGKPDALFDAWLELPDPIRSKLDAELRDIHAMCGEKGWVSIADEAHFQFKNAPDQLAAFLEAMAALPGHQDRAMVTFLDHPACWKGATRFNHSDGLTYWKKRKNLPKKPAAVDPESLAMLSGLIRNYFRHYDGRGQNCVVEPLRRGNKDYYFAFPEDHSQNSVEWQSGEFHPATHTPAFEIVFVYCQDDGTLDLNFRGINKTVAALQEIFAQTILKLGALPPDQKDERVYDLKPLLKKDFEFSYGAGSGIQRAVVKKLRMTARYNKGERITLEADSSFDPLAIYDLLDRIGKAVPLNLYNITQVEFSALMAGTNGKPPKQTSFKITYPNSCSLKYEESDLKLRAMLEASGIEPRAPAAASAAPATPA